MIRLAVAVIAVAVSFACVTRVVVVPAPEQDEPDPQPKADPLPNPDPRAVTLLPAPRFQEPTRRFLELSGFWCAEFIRSKKPGDYIGKCYRKLAKCSMTRNYVVNWGWTSTECVQTDAAVCFDIIELNMSLSEWHCYESVAHCNEDRDRMSNSGDYGERFMFSQCRMNASADQPSRSRQAQLSR